MANKERKIAFFDFCETLANFQTADAYVDFIRQKTENPRMIRLEKLRDWLKSHKVFWLINRITRNKYPLYKVSKLYQLRGFDKVDLEMYAHAYYKEKIKPNLILDIMDILKRKKKEGFHIVIVSGGYDIYLKYFVEEYEVDYIISTRIGFSNNKATGFFYGKDCLNKNKVLLLNSVYQDRNFYSEAYSDSVTDVPFLSWVDNGFVISKKQHQNWVNNYKFKEIIWGLD